jgi:hypothetical protein
MMKVIMNVKVMIVGVMMIDELIEIHEQLSTGYEKKRNECKALQKELKALKQSFDELKHLISVQTKTMRNLALLTLSFKKLTPLYLSKLRRKRSRQSK